MKRKLSVIEAIIKTRNIETSNLEEKLNLPKGYISKVTDGKIIMKPMILIKLLQELDITLEQYEKLNAKAKELYEDSTISNQKRWQNLLIQIYLISPLKSIEEVANSKHKK